MFVVVILHAKQKPKVEQQLNNVYIQISNSKLNSLLRRNAKRKKTSSVSDFKTTPPITQSIIHFSNLRADT
jgi:hypothetical protein